MQTNNHEENRNDKEEEYDGRPIGCAKTALWVLYIFIAVVVFIFGACFILPI